ncbi:MAG: hypothetical protein Q7R62_00655 [bacterium]|nr:hypothetical protein [bacterium]
MASMKEIAEKRGYLLIQEFPGLADWLMQYQHRLYVTSRAYRDGRELPSRSVDIRTDIGLFRVLIYCVWPIPSVRDYEACHGFMGKIVEIWEETLNLDYSLLDFMGHYIRGCVLPRARKGWCETTKKPLAVFLADELETNPENSALRERLHEVAHLTNS